MKGAAYSKALRPVSLDGAVRKSKLEPGERLPKRS